MDHLVVYVVILIYPDKSKYVVGVFKSLESAEHFVRVSRCKAGNYFGCEYRIYDFPVFD